MKTFFCLIFFATLCTAKATLRIIGGENALIQSYPYQVSLEYQGIYYCGGSIVSQYHVLTAAHCQKPVSLLQVRAGTSFPGTGGSLHNVSSFTRHPNYRLSIIAVNDIAVIKIKEPFIFNQTQQPINLFSKGQNLQSGSIAIVTGFGKIRNGMQPYQLQMATLRIISKGMCSSIYWVIGGIPRGQICARASGKSTCFGDSGGPLVINNRLAGIVSWAGSGCDTRYPSGYTEVAYYRDWIDEYLI